MKIKGYALDEDGKLVPPGPTKLVYDCSFVLGEGLPTAPAWLQTPATNGSSASLGTGGAVTHSAASPGSYLVQTGPTLDANARLATVGIPMNQYAGIMFQVFGAQLNNSNGASDDVPVLFSFGIHNMSPTGPANAGGRVIQRHTDPHMRFAMPGVSGDRGEFGASVRTLREGYRYRNHGMLLLPRTKQMVYFEDDPENPVATYDGSAEMLSGIVCGAISIQTKTAANQTLRMAGARLTLWRDPETL